MSAVGASTVLRNSPDSDGDGTALIIVLLNLFDLLPQTDKMTAEHLRSFRRQSRSTFTAERQIRAIGYLLAHLLQYAMYRFIFCNGISSPSAFSSGCVGRFIWMPMTCLAIIYRVLVPHALRMN